MRPHARRHVSRVCPAEGISYPRVSKAGMDTVRYKRIGLSFAKAASTGAHPMDRPDHVLIVDDDLELRELLVAYLGKNGFRVTAAADGRQMQAALAASPVDLIV